MGMIVHNAMVLTGERKNLVLAAKVARKIGLLVVGPHKGEVTNGYCSMLIAPNGSKLGWETCENGREQRAQFKDWLTEYGTFEWVEVQFGDEQGGAIIIAENK